MWDEYVTWFIIAFAVIGALLSHNLWGQIAYTFSKHWQITSFLFVMALFSGLVVFKGQEFKYEVAFSHYIGTAQTSSPEARYQIRQCKEFVSAKMNGESVTDYRSLTAGMFKINTISNWEFCARTFAMNYWQHDISIDGQNGGRLLCEAYAHDTYRSGKVQNWCDTVFAPATKPTEQKI